MCGIFSVITDFSPDKKEKTVDAFMRLSHRGPDDSSHVFYKDRLLLAHKRLSIIAPGSSSNQPFSVNDDATLIYNGELYNYRSLRDELRNLNHVFNTDSDTEVILRAYLEWGDSCFQKFNGMWSVVLLDKKKNSIICSRDRFGIKPLYISISQNQVILSSEIKAILPLLPEVREHSEMVDEFLMFARSDYGKHTMFRDVDQVEAGSILRVELSSLKMQVHKFWDYQEEFKRQQIKTSDNCNWVQEFKEVFNSSIQRHLISDVPVGVQLSGGLDSASIASSILKENDRELHSFSMVYHEENFSERKYVETVSSMYPNLNCHFIYPETKNLFQDVRNLIYHQDLPSRSFAVLMQKKLYEYVHAQTKVKVVLAGQGGDEILAGYNEHNIYLMLHNLYQGNLSELKDTFRFQMTQKGLIPLLKEFCVKGIKDLTGVDGLHYLGINEFKRKYLSIRGEYLKDPVHHSLFENVTKFSLPEYLRYEDRNSMASSIESRVPFLDFELVKLCMRLPLSELIRPGSSKHIMRVAMQGVVPTEILSRKDKMGFVTPHEVWFKKYLLEDLLALYQTYSSDPRMILLKKSLDEYVMGKGKDHFFWWRVYNYLLWKQIFKVA